MKHKLLGFFLAFATLFLPLTLKAQNTFEVNAPSVVEVGETFRVVFTASDKIKDFSQPDFGGLEVLAGPSSSTMLSTKIINGKRTQTYEESYTYILQAEKEGKYSIGSASAKIDGKIQSTQPFTIEVVKTAPSSSNEGTTSSRSQGASENDFVLRMDVSKKNVVKGEPIILTLKFYTKSQISGFEDVKFPVFDGFWSQEIEVPTQIEFQRETLNGQIYNAALLRKYMLLPQQSGTLTIEPAEISCIYQVRSSSSGRSFFDDFFDSGYQTLRKRVHSPRIEINVANLPSGAPASFTGGVGDFKMGVTLSRDSVTAHEAVSLIVKITGSGNINLIEPPKVVLPPDFEAYDVKRTEKITSGANGVSGSKSFEFPFIPRSPGSFEIEPIKFSYYDIKAKKYVTLSSPATIIDVARGEETSAVVMSGGVGKQLVKSLGEDIRFIATDSSTLKLKTTPLLQSWLFGVLMGSIAILFVVLCAILDKSIKRRKDIAGTRNRKAKKIARARLKKAESFLKDTLYSAFYEELHKAVQGYVSDKFTIPVADLNRDNIREAMLSRGDSQELVDGLFAILDACEYARYAPSTGYTAMENHYKDAIKVISEIER